MYRAISDSQWLNPPEPYVHPRGQLFIQRKAHDRSPLASYTKRCQESRQSLQREIVSLQESQGPVSRVVTAGTLGPVHVGSDSGSPLTSWMTQLSDSWVLAPVHCPGKVGTIQTLGGATA